MAEPKDYPVRASAIAFDKPGQYAPYVHVNNFEVIIVLVDQLEALITLTNNHVDNVEPLLTALNTYVDGLEGIATTINGNVDQLEAISTANGIIAAAIRDAVDGLEASLASVDSKSSTIITNTEETADSVASLDTKATTSNTNTGATATNTGNINNQLTDVRDDAANAFRVRQTPTSIGDGVKNVAAAATAEALASTTPSQSVVITAKTTNVGEIVVGGSTVVALSGGTRRGTPLAAGDSIKIDIDNLSKIFLDSTVSGEGVTFTYVGY